MFVYIHISGNRPNKFILLTTDTNYSYKLIQWSQYLGESIVLPNDFAEVLRAPKPLLEDVEGQALACPSD